MLILQNIQFYVVELGLRNRWRKYRNELWNTGVQLTAPLVVVSIPRRILTAAPGDGVEVPQMIEYCRLNIEYLRSASLRAVSSTLRPVGPTGWKRSRKPARRSFIRGQMTHLHTQSTGPRNRAEDSDLSSVLCPLLSVLCYLSSD